MTTSNTQTSSGPATTLAVDIGGSGTQVALVGHGSIVASNRLAHTDRLVDLAVGDGPPRTRGDLHNPSSGDMTVPVAPAASTSSYDLRPKIVLTLPGERVTHGRDAYQHIIDTARAAAGGEPVRIAIDAYPGVDVSLLATELSDVDPTFTVIDVEREAALSGVRLDEVVASSLLDDPVFGVRTDRDLRAFFDAERLDALRVAIDGMTGDVIVVGWGATMSACSFHTVVLADLPRREIQQRLRQGGTNWRISNGDEPMLEKYKRGFFVEWRMADLHKTPLLDTCDFFLDSSHSPLRMITGDAFRHGLATATRRPFRVVPFFDPGPWGGRWMRDTFALEPDPSGHNYAWCFDCVPEENSLVFELDGGEIELPSINVVLARPVELLGQHVVERFGAEFPIRFDLLDTLGGGNLSLQVHPTVDYISKHFGIPYTQDESYYFLHAAPDAVMYLGIRDGVDPTEMVNDLRVADEGGPPFDAERYVNVVPVATHDHAMVPAGTVHAAGAGTVVLEVSATPFIFTFKLWDWGRLGLDGRPRPTHLDRGIDNICWGRDTHWVHEEGVNQVRTLSSTDGCREERTGLHDLEFIETRRHWFTEPVDHDTNGGVAVVNLVEGDQVVVESPSGSFEPFVVHYAETFIVPAAVGPFRISPAGTHPGPYATLKASVRDMRPSQSSEGEPC